MCGRQTNTGRRQIWPLKEASLALLLFQTGSLLKKREKEDCVFSTACKGAPFSYFLFVCVCLFLLKNIVKKTLQVWFPRWRPRAVDAQSTSKSLANVAQPQTPGLSLTSSAWSQTLSKSHRSLLETESSLLPLLIPDHKHPLTRIF